MLWYESEIHQYSLKSTVRGNYCSFNVLCWKGGWYKTTTKTVGLNKKANSIYEQEQFLK